MIYILQKDIGYLKAGVECTVWDGTVYYIDLNQGLPYGAWVKSTYKKDLIENNPELFKLQGA